MPPAADKETPPGEGGTPINPRRDIGERHSTFAWLREPAHRGWSYNLFDGELIVRVEEITTRSAKTDAWVAITDAHALAAGRHPVVYGRHNLESSRIATQLAGEWDAAHGAETRHDKVGSISEVMKAILTDALIEHREGPDLVALRRQTTDRGSRYLLEPFIEQTGHSRLIAQGGSGKSYLALAMGIQLATGEIVVPGVSAPTRPGPVAYLDWESDERTHGERLERLLRGADIHGDLDGILYRNMKSSGGGPLHRQAQSVARRIAERGCVAAIVDSVMLARGSSGEGGAEDTTVRMFEALDELAVPCLLIDHKSKQQIESRSGKGGYGSVVMTNSVRSEWDITKTLTHDHSLAIGIEHTKANNGPRLPSVALEFDFADDMVRLARLPHFPTMGAAGGTVADDIQQHLLAGPTAATDIAKQLGKTDNNVRSVLNRMKKEGRAVKTDGLWALPNGPQHTLGLEEPE